MTIIPNLADIYAHPEAYLLSANTKKLFLVDDASNLVGEYHQTEDGIADELSIIILDSKQGVKRHRTTDYIEFEIEHPTTGGKGSFKRLYTLPITEEYRERALFIEQELKRVKSALFLPFKVVNLQFFSRENLFKSVVAPVVIQDIPDSELLMDYAQHSSNSELDRVERSLIRMQETLHHAGIYIPELSAQNIIVCGDGTLHPRSCHNIQFEKGIKSTIEIDNLRCWLASFYDRNDTAPLHTVEVDTPQSRLLKEFPGHIWCGDISEDRLAVEDKTGFGFVDMHNNVTIESKYEWVGNYKEGRAIVKERSGYGVIDVWGRVVLEARYDSVTYNPRHGLIAARMADSKWAYFTYGGEQLTPFSVDYPDDKISHHMVLQRPDALIRNRGAKREPSSSL